MLGPYFSESEQHHNELKLITKKSSNNRSHLMRKKRSFLTFYTGLFLCKMGILSSPIFQALPSKAQIAISPTIIETSAERGQAQAIITINNGSSLTYKYTLSTSPFTYDDTGFIALTESENDLGQFLRFSPRELIIAPNTRRQIRLVALLNPSLADGEYRSAIAVVGQIHNIPSSGDSTSESSQASFQYIPTSIIPVYVRKGEIDEVILGEEISFSTERKQVEITVNNAGSSTEFVGFEWKIKQNDMLIEEGSQAPHTVIAGTKRSIPVNHSADITPGTYEISGHLSFTTDNQKMVELPFASPIEIPLIERETMQ